MKTMTLTGCIAAAAALFVSGCQSGDGSDESGNTAKRKTLTEEDRQFEEAGRNSLGVETGDFDLRVVVGAGLSLDGEDIALPPEGDDSQGEEALGEDHGANGDAADAAHGNDDDKAKKADADDADEAETDDDGVVEEAKEHEIQACSDFFGQPATGLHVTGNKTRVDVEPSQYIALKISGNQADVNLLFTKPVEAVAVETTAAAALAEDDDTAAEAPQEHEIAAIDGICIIASGNQPTVNVVLNGVAVGKVFFKAAGNQAAASFDVKNGASVGSFAADLKGNAGLLKVTGDGQYTCDGIETSGSAAQPECGP